MKNFIFLLSLLFGVHLSFSQEDGAYEELYDNGQLKISGQYKNNKRIGEWKEYYESGSLKSVYSYSKGKRNREIKTYFEDGNLKSETKKIGDTSFETKAYNKNGTLFFEKVSPNGIYKEYYDIQELKIESIYNDGELSGIWKQFYKDGNVEWEVAFTNGYKHGIYKEYYPNGKIKLEGSHKLSEKDGKEIHFDEAGNLIDELKYKKGKLLKSKKEKPEEVKVPDGTIERVPIYPGCENFLQNKLRKKCMSELVSQFVNKNFNSNLINAYGLPSGKKIKIYLMFKISKTGELIEAEGKSPLPVLSNEAVRVINLLPKMKPGIQRGKPVVVPYSLPIVFQVK